jgi:hypothetical protein
MRPVCPACGASLSSLAVDLQDHVSTCPACGELTSVTLTTSASGHIRATPPAPEGCSITQDGTSITLSASCRDITKAVVIALGTSVWLGLIVMFFYPVIGAIYEDWLGPLPAWMPSTASSQYAVTRPVPAVDTGISLFLLSWFLLPFPFVIFWYLPMAIAGTLRITITDSTATTFYGFGRLGRTRSIPLTSIQRIYVYEHPLPPNETTPHPNSSPLTWLLIDTDRPIKLGYLLHPTEQAWLAATLAQIILPRSTAKS